MTINPEVWVVSSRSMTSHTRLRTAFGFSSARRSRDTSPYCGTVTPTRPNPMRTTAITTHTSERQREKEAAANIRITWSQCTGSRTAGTNGDYSLAQRNELPSAPTSFNSRSVDPSASVGQRPYAAAGDLRVLHPKVTTFECNLKP